MNKPAPKEPSMDEILSSIRQIIADDDASAARKPAPPAPAAPLRSFAPVPPRPIEPAVPPMPQPQPEPEPLALSAEQILRDTALEDERRPAVSYHDPVAVQPPAPSMPQLVDPDDITFESEPEQIAPPPPPVQAMRPVPAYERPRPVSVAHAAPLPDPRLSADLAEQLLEPATQSVIKNSFSKLSSLSTVGANVTIEEMMRDMLRPMLKEWLDENLPSLVERIVEQEIARVSRGGR